MGGKEENTKVAVCKNVVSSRERSPFKSRSYINPQSSHFKGRKRRSKRNDECGIDQQRGQQPGTQPSTEEMGRVEKLGKHNTVVDTKYSAGTRRSREGGEAMQHFR